MTVLLRLYPRAWRARYETEMRELLAAQPRTLRLAIDLVAGAIDARVNPQWTPRHADDPKMEGVAMMKRIFDCRASGMTAAERKRTAAWLIGGSLTAVGMSTVLTLAFGRTSFSEALLYAAYPMTLVGSSECGYLKRYSTPAKWSMIVATSAFILGLTWAAVAAGDRF